MLNRPQIVLLMTLVAATAMVPAARLDIFPWGPIKYDQADFDRGPIKAGFAGAIFGSENDGDSGLVFNNEDICPLHGRVEHRTEFSTDSVENLEEKTPGIGGKC